MLDRFEHWTNQRLRFQANDAGNATHKSNLKRPALTKRVEDAERSSRCRGQLFDSDGRRTTRQHALADAFYLWPLSLVLSLAVTKIVEHETLAGAEDLDAFFR